MVAAIIASALVMTAEKINNLVTRYPGFKTLALLFLVLLGGLLMAEGFAIHINKRVCVLCDGVWFGAGTVSYPTKEQTAPNYPANQADASTNRGLWCPITY